MFGLQFLCSPLRCSPLFFSLLLLCLSFDSVLLKAGEGHSELLLLGKRKCSSELPTQRLDGLPETFSAVPGFLASIEQSALCGVQLPFGSQLVDFQLLDV